MDTGADKYPLLGLLFQAFYCVSLCHRIPAPYCFCISSLADGARNWKKTIEFSPSCSCSPHLCNRMNHFNTKLCFLPNKQDLTNILPWQRGLMQSSFMWQETWGYSAGQTLALLLLSSPIYLLWFLICLPLTQRKKRLVMRVFFTSAGFRATKKGWQCNSYSLVPAEQERWISRSPINFLMLNINRVTHVALWCKFHCSVGLTWCLFCSTSPVNSVEGSCVCTLGMDRHCLHCV